MHSTTLHQYPISTPSTARPRTPSPFRCPIALSSYHPNPTHDSNAPRRQLDGGVPPAADGRGGARPVGSCVGALGVLAAERSWWLLTRTASARRSVQPLSRGRASSPWSTLPAGTPRRRSPVSSMGCPPSGFGVRGTAVPVSGHRAGRPEGPAVCCPAVQRPAVRCPAVWCLPPSVRTRPSPPMLRRWRWGPGRGGRATLTTGTGGGPCGCRAVDGSIDGRGGRDAGDAAEVALVSGRWLADPGRRVGWGRRRPRLPAEQPGRPGRRSERPSRAAARWARVQAAAPGCRMPRGWRPRAGCATTVGGRRRAGRPGGRPRRGQGRCRRRGACGPSAAQADSECSQLAAGSALTCDDGWWACQDLNLGPHPYQVSRAKHCAQGRFPRSPLSVRGQGMRS